MQKCLQITKNARPRTSIIYEPQGRAREYAELAANLYRGCDHGCTYCYAPLATRTNRESFHQPSVRNNVIEKFRHDAKELERVGETRPILLSFTTDPYQHLDIKEKLTRKAIDTLHYHNLKVTILTKGGKRSERDFDLLTKRPELSEYGVTLVFINEEQREEIEPFAASTYERINSLKRAHNQGIRTYVSLEPVWEPKQTLKLIEMTSDFVDFYKVGKLNYHSQKANVDWRKFRIDVCKKLNDLGKNYYIKEDLKKFI
ncbi:MAG: radical SAM protein [Methanolinea sp.]|jgi:DNA repair photolyase